MSQQSVIQLQIVYSENQQGGGTIIALLWLLENQTPKIRLSEHDEPVMRTIKIY